MKSAEARTWQITARKFAFPAIFFAIFIATMTFTHMPHGMLPEPYLQVRRAHLGWSDKAAHLLAYGVVTIGLWFWVTPRLVKAWGSDSLHFRILITLISVLLISFCDEVTQIPFGRNFGVWDVVFNLVGGITTITILVLLPRVRSERASA